MAHGDEVGLPVAVQLADRDRLGLGCCYEATLGPKPATALVCLHDDAGALGDAEALVEARYREARFAVASEVPNCDRAWLVVLAAGCGVPRGPEAAVAAVHEHRDARTLGVDNR